MTNWKQYSSSNPESWMILGLLNTLVNNNTISKEERNLILKLGEYIFTLRKYTDQNGVLRDYISENGTLRDASEVHVLLNSLIGKLNKGEGDPK